jgi:hypothetical protein
MAVYKCKRLTSWSNSLSVKLGCGAVAGIIGTSMCGFPLLSKALASSLIPLAKKCTEFIQWTWSRRGSKIVRESLEDFCIVSRVFLRQRASEVSTEVCRLHPRNFSFSDCHRSTNNYGKGLVANLVGISPEKAIKLAVNDSARGYWARRLGVQESDLPLPYGMLSGATAGMCQVIATNPMEITKINLQVSTGASKPSTLDVIRGLGLRGLYKGTGATLCRDVPFSFFFFPSLSLLKSAVPKTVEGTTPFYGVFWSGIIAGAFSSAIVTPMDGTTSLLWNVVDSN